MRKPNTPPRGLHKTLSVLAAGVMLTAGMAALPANAATTSYPDHIVNGDFEYPRIFDNQLKNRADWTAIAPSDGTYLDWAETKDASTAAWKPITGFNATTFAWTSTQDSSNYQKDHQQKAGAVELQQDNKTGNYYAELCADQAGTAIYQDIATTPGAVYTWRLKHTSLSSKHVDSMSVMIGAPGKETAQQAYRETVNGNGDKIGPVGTTIATVTATPPNTTMEVRNHDTQWETYSGSYTIPAGQTVTRFTFKSLAGMAHNYGNLLDDISFSVSYPLHYDLKGGSGTAPQQHD